MTLGSVAGGQAKIIGLFAQERNPAIPDVPTVKEQGFDVTPTSFGGLFAPVKLPADVKQKLEAACEKAASSPRYLETAKRLRLGQKLFLPAAQFEQRLQQDIKEKADILSTLK
jgi:tripartite-type tricarboxylate transporter receptor subunit TctC